VADFLGAIVSTMQNWRDMLQRAAPGARERVFTIRHTTEEGGLNLDMGREAIEAMARSGALAAREITAAFLAFVVYLQTSTTLEARRLAKELKSQRELADSAEASRFTELRNFLAQELAALRTLSGDSDAKLVSRVDAAEQALRTDIEHAGNTLAAYIGELEHRLDSPTADRASADRR
jgi:hypothetical protein